MPVLYVRLSIMCALCLAVIGLAAGSEWETGRVSRAAPPIEWHCPPCGRSLPTSTELVWLHGRRWALCGAECRAAVESDPARYAALAVE